MTTDKYFEIGQTVWYLDSMWAHPGKVSRRRITYPENYEEYQINDKWIPGCFAFAEKEDLKQALIHHIDHNSNPI